jgi:NADH-quinone oxidoreductase subunit J
MTNEHWWVGVLTALLLVGVMGYALVDGFSDDKLPHERVVTTVEGSNTATVSDSIFAQYLVPFEVVSVLLLAALVGAIVIARKDR